MLSPATLPGNWGTSMATEYGITSFALAGDVGRGTSIWFVDTTRQKSRSRSTKVDTDRDKRDKRNTVKRITKFEWSQVRIQPVCYATVVPLTTQYFPQILHTVRIYKALVYSTRHFQQIALLNVLSKVMESLTKDHMSYVFETCNLLGDCQQGFRQTRSTKLALWRFVSSATSTLKTQTLMCCCRPGHSKCL